MNIESKLTFPNLTRSGGRVDFTQWAAVNINRSEINVPPQSKRIV